MYVSTNLGIRNYLKSSVNLFNTDSFDILKQLTFEKKIRRHLRRQNRNIDIVYWMRVLAIFVAIAKCYQRFGCYKKIRKYFKLGKFH